MNDLKLNLIQPIAVMLITLGLFKFLRKTESLKVPPVLDVDPISDQEYKSVSFKANMLTIAAAILVAAVSYFVFVAVARLIYNFVIPSERMIVLPEIAYFLPAIVMGFSFSHLPYRAFLLKTLGPRESAFYARMDQQFKFNTKKFGKMMYQYGVIVSFLFYVYLMSFCSTISGDQVSVRRFGFLGQRVYQLQDIDKIEDSDRIRAPNGNAVCRHNFKVTFRDGWEWPIDDEDDARSLVHYLSDKAGLKIQPVDML